MSSGQQTSHLDDHVTQRKDTGRDEHQHRMEPTSPRERSRVRGIPVSASMSSFAASTTRLPLSKKWRYATLETLGQTPIATGDATAPTTTHALTSTLPETPRGTQRMHGEVAPGTSTSAPRRAAPLHVWDRPKSSGRSEVWGPGATHWSEPWLNVRSKADWHRLAQRFRKTQEEYISSRQRLEAEKERLERELELASVEEASQASGVPAGNSLLFSRTQLPAMTRGMSMQRRAVNTAINSRTRSSSRSKPTEDGDESPEEGEMRCRTTSRTTRREARRCCQDSEERVSGQPCLAVDTQAARVGGGRTSAGLCGAGRPRQAARGAARQSESHASRAGRVQGQEWRCSYRIAIELLLCFVFISSSHTLAHCNTRFHIDPIEPGHDFFIGPKRSTNAANSRYRHPSIPPRRPPDHPHSSRATSCT